MSHNQVRDVLNRLRWDVRSEPAAVVLVVRHREGGREVLGELPFAAVVEILAGGVTVADGTYLPYHRVTAVSRGDETLWRRSASHEE